MLYTTIQKLAKFVRLFDVFNYIYLKPPHVDKLKKKKRKHQCYWELAQMRTEKSQS
jgi:hypothetical protein